MASGHARTALTGRTHGCTDQRCDVKFGLANQEPSTHGTWRTFGVTWPLLPPKPIFPGPGFEFRLAPQ